MQPIKWHGGKAYLAARIVETFPRHTHYCEPFAGGLSVLFAKPYNGISECVNDLDRDLFNFWRVIADSRSFAKFYRIIQATPFSEDVWRHTVSWEQSPILSAANFFARCRQSFGGAGKTFSPVAKRVRRGMNEHVSAWLTAIEGLPEVHDRLKRVLILNRPASDCILANDSPATLFYLDPPYLPDTRASKQVYSNEMSTEAHASLLSQLTTIKGKFALSGYDSPMYAEWAAKNNYRCVKWDMANNASGGSDKRRMVECLWSNFA